MSWDSNGGNQGPWGGGNRNRGGRGNPPDIEDLIRKGQERLKTLFPQGGHGGRGLVGGLVVLALLWASTGFYRVTERQQAVVLRFGKWTGVTYTSGLRYHLPYPFEQAFIEEVTKVRNIDSRVSPQANSLLSGKYRLMGDNSLNSSPNMLTGDMNIADVKYKVQWYIKDLGQFLFKAQSPEVTVRMAAESVVREAVAQASIAGILSRDRSRIEDQAAKLLQNLVDEYKLGVQIMRVQLQEVDPPSRVKDSFFDVQRAEADKNTKRNGAESYRNSIIPVANGKAVEIVKKAEAYAESLVKQAEGEAGRFNLIFDQLKKSPETIRKKIYFDAMKKIYEKAQKFIVQQDKGGAFTSYLPLPEVKKRSPKAEVQESQ